MRDYVVGDTTCPIDCIVTAMMGSVDNAKFSTDWRQLATALEMETFYTGIRAFIAELQRRMDRGDRTGIEAIADVLSEWRSVAGKEAKLEKLLNVLENTLGWGHSADKIRRKIWSNLPEKVTWEELDDKSQQFVLNSEVKFFGKETAFANIVNKLREPDLVEFFSKDFTGIEIKQILNEPERVNLAQNKKSEIPAHYIPRTVCRTQQVNTQVLQAKCDDYFVVDKIQFAVISKLAGPTQFVDRTSTQTGTLSSRIFLLDSKSGFDQICKLAGNKSVHWLTFREEKLYWRKTKGSLDTIREYLMNENVELFSETVYLQNLNSSDGNFNTAVCISDDAGMGKTTFLSSLYGQVQRKYPHRYSAHFKFPELLDHFCKKCVNSEVTKFDVHQCLAELLGKSSVGIKLLKKLFKEEQQRIELFLDAYDEIPEDQLELAENLLRVLTTEFQNIRVYVTTNKFLQEKLEQILQVLSVSLQLFQELEQENFLKLCWSHKFSAPNDDQGLLKFSKRLVETLSQAIKSNSVEAQILSVPLHCAIVAEIYEQDAKAKIGEENDTTDFAVNIHSVCGLYNKLFDKRLSGATQTHENLHILGSVEVLLPEFTPRLQQLFPVSLDKYTIDRVNSMGLMHVSKDKNIEQITYRFVHKTYAECILAQFLITSLKHSKLASIVVEILAHILQNLQKMKLKGKYDRADCLIYPTTNNFVMPGLCFFIDDVLHCAYGVNVLPKNSISLAIVNAVLEASLHANYASIFNLVTQIVVANKQQISTASPDMSAWTNLLAKATLYSKPDMVRECKAFLDKILNTPIHTWEYPGVVLGNVSVTPLHLAAVVGNSVKFDYFAKLYGSHISEVKCLMHCCVRWSLDDARKIVGQKKEILGLLRQNQYCQAILQETTANDRKTALLMERVHYDLLEYLIENRANARTVDSANETVAHKASLYLSPEDMDKFVKLLDAKNQSSIWVEGYHQNIPIYIALRQNRMNFCTVKFLIEKLKCANLLANHMDSALYSAVEGTRDERVIKLLAENGADLLRKYGQVGMSLVHVAVYCSNLEAIKCLVDLGCCVNALDSNKLTPLHYAAKDLRVDVYQVVKLLIDLKANWQAKDKKHRTPLWYAEHRKQLAKRWIDQRTISLLKGPPGEKSDKGRCTIA